MIRHRSIKKRDGRLKDSAKEDARRAVELAARNAVEAAAKEEEEDLWWRKAMDGHGDVNEDAMSYAGGADNLSHSSFISTELAMQRGKKRGLFEKLEKVHSGDDASIDRSFHQDIHQHPPTTTTRTTATKTHNTSRSGNTNDKDSKSKLLNFFPKKNKQKSKKKKLKNITSEISNEAWICGVCARSFSSYEAAEKHELYHIKEVVTDLGWSTALDSDGGSRFDFMQDPSRTNNNDFDAQQPPSDLLVGESSSARHNNHVLETPTTTTTTTARPHLLSSKSSQPRPDVLRMSTPALSPRVGYMPPNTPALQRNKPRPGRRFSVDDSQFYDGGLMAGGGAAGGFGLYTTGPGYQSMMSPIMEHQQQQQRRTSFPTNDDLMLPRGMKGFVVLADEALVDVCHKATQMMLTNTEKDAELELEWLAKDKSYYDYLAERERERDLGNYNTLRSEGKTIASKVQNKFVDAYQLMKEGKKNRGATSMDHYKRKAKGGLSESNDVVLKHTQKTLYVNVIVKNSIQVVSNELERLAKERWKDDDQATTMRGGGQNDEQADRFQKFRSAAQGNLVKLAGLALASDFTPRRIAIQLSNDLYRLLTPRLKKRGVVIETEIEYRVGPYFVLAVNISGVDWRRLVKTTNRDVAMRNKKWHEENNKDEESESDSKSSGVIVSFIKFGIQLSKMTKYECLAQTLAWFYYLHWIIYTPICWALYSFIMPTTFREYFLSSVTDEIFYYVEEKGMDMDIGIRDASTQAAFMLSALREIRADGQEMKKKQKEGEADGKGTILGPLLGAAIKEDKSPAPPKPEGFEIPENLEFIGLELDLPVGFRRMRQAFLSSKSTFLSEAVFRAEAKYENIEMGEWTKHNNEIGLAKLPDNVKEEDFIGVERESKYLMPKSAFVKANMCYETASIEAYNDYCFCLKKKALTPEVPYGGTFVAWTKFVFINTGDDTCRLVCSVEAEFPNGPPMVGRQIKSGMRAGVGELFVLIGETIIKYADEYP